MMKNLDRVQRYRVKISFEMISDLVLKIFPRHMKWSLTSSLQVQKKMNKKRTGCKDFLSKTNFQFHQTSMI